MLEGAAASNAELEGERRQMVMDAARVVVLAFNLEDLDTLLMACGLLREAVHELEELVEQPAPIWRRAAAEAEPPRRDPRVEPKEADQAEQPAARPPAPPSPPAATATRRRNVVGNEPIGRAAGGLAELDRVIIAERRADARAARLRQLQRAAEPAARPARAVAAS